MNETILIVDDEPSILTLLEFNLQKEGYDVLTAEDGEQAIEMVKTKRPALMILDLMLPKIDGMQVCKQLRLEKINIPILMLTAKDDELDKILGLELGADDYLTKPFSPREVIARVRAILRRSHLQDEQPDDMDQPIRIGQLEIQPDQYEATYKGELLELTPKEFELLHYLAKHKGKVMTRDQLLNAIWNYDFIGDTRIVDVHISHLREKINKKYIKTVRGLGYKMDGSYENE